MSLVIDLENKKKERKEEKVQEDFLLLFVSFDLVNSTKFKNTTNDWVKVIKEFYKNIENLFTVQTQSKIPRESKVNFEVWKLLGDEIILKAKITSIEELTSSISDSYKILNYMVKLIEKYELLSVKATAWLALIDGDINHEIKIEKNIYCNEENKNFIFDIKDYIGQSMDEGFRVSSKIAKQRKLAVDFNIAFLLTNNNLNHRVFYLGLTKLKGVWKDRGYPAIWYSEDLEGDRKNTAYDAEIDCEYSKVFMNENNNDVLYKLDKINKDINPPHLEKIKIFYLHST